MPQNQKTITATVRINSKPTVGGIGYIYDVMDMGRMEIEQAYFRSKEVFEVGKELQIEYYIKNNIYFVNEFLDPQIAEAFDHEDPPVEIAEEEIINLPDLIPASEVEEPETDDITDVSDLPAVGEHFSIARIKQFIETYEYVKKHLIKPSDIQTIQTRDGPREFVKKAGWRKFVTCFGISLELISREERVKEGVLEFEVHVRAHAPMGYVDGIAICQQNEKQRFRTRHETMTTAFTRAVNRAVSDMVGFGEVSAEELE